VISPHAGASLRSLRVRTSGGQWFELLTGGQGPHSAAELPQGTGSFIMAPWPSRLRNGILHANGSTYQMPPNRGPDASHGLVRDQQWSVASATSSKAILTTGLDDPWPFKGRVVYEASLEGASLRQSIDIEAGEDEVSFPAGLGWHPWFRRDLGTGLPSVFVPGQRSAWEQRADFSATGVQLGPEQAVDFRSGLVADQVGLDQCMTVEHGSEAVVDWPNAVRLAIHSSEVVSHVHVYITRDSICIEPESCTFNAFRLAAEGIGDTGARQAEPGRPLSGSTRWSWD
jgi:aldose 1-epimerase